MTKEESLAIKVLTSMVEGIARANEDAHKVILDRIDRFAHYCEKREQEVDDRFHEREIRFEAHINQARDEAIYEATKPSAYRVATKGLWKLLVAAAGFLATVAGLVYTLDHFWGG